MSDSELNERQEQILEQLREAGHVQVDGLARLFDVTTQTIRRDLSELCDRGLAARVHGGARRGHSTTALAYEERSLNRIEAKRAIAHQAAQLVPHGATIALNIGTTTEQVAEALKLHRDLTVISNNINIVHILRGSRLRSLIIAGGEVRLSDGAVIGSDAVDAIRNYKADYAIIGASSMDEDGSVLDFDQREVAVARAILANARIRILACDATKFQISAPHRICQANELDFVVTDTMPPDPFIAHLGASSTELIVTDERNTILQ